MGERPARKKNHSRDNGEDDRHDDEDDMVNDDDSVASAEEIELGAHLEDYVNQPACGTWQEARDQVITELNLNDKQKRLIILISAIFSSSPEDQEKEMKQHLVYVSGEGSTGKS